MRSITLDTWEPEQLKVMLELGNAVVNGIYEAAVDESIAVRAKPDSNRSVVLHRNMLMSVLFVSHKLPFLHIIIFTILLFLLPLVLHLLLGGPLVLHHDHHYHLLVGLVSV